MIKQIHNSKILIITQSKWNKWKENTKENECLFRIENILCAYTVNKVWIEKCVYTEVLNNEEVMKCIHAHLDDNSTHPFDYI